MTIGCCLFCLCYTPGGQTCCCRSRRGRGLWTLPCSSRTVAIPHMTGAAGAAGPALQGSPWLLSAPCPSSTPPPSMLPFPWQEQPGPSSLGQQHLVLQVLLSQLCLHSCGMGAWYSFLVRYIMYGITCTAVTAVACGLRKRFKACCGMWEPYGLHTSQCQTQKDHTKQIHLQGLFSSSSTWRLPHAVLLSSPLRNRSLTGTHKHADNKPKFTF